MSSQDYTDSPTERTSHENEGAATTTDDRPTVESLAEDVSPNSGPLDLDTVFELLRNRRRRLVLSHLMEADERVDIGTLAEHVAAIENDTTERALSSSERKRAYVGLYQCHLPKLADAGVVEYDRDRGHVEPTAATAELMTYVDRDDTDERNWPLLYQCTAGVVGGVYLVAALASAVVTVPWALVGASTLLFGGVALAHALSS